ncbi:MAG: aminotransferase class V-fold PLP-dependent enzyme, partial [Clostridia bacterium]|nr:aminotransferase class V-fold PLP-dependent enzyme [Clostridia bacterium]
ERYEAGTLPTPAIAGLCEGIREVRRRGVEAIFAHECALNARLRERLLSTNGVTVYAPEQLGSVLLFSVNGMSSDAIGQALNERGFCVRAGFHCAALAHATLRTPAGGAVRVSPGLFSTASQMDAFADTLEEILKK